MTPIEQQRALMAFIGTEERILREEGDQGAEADPTRWGGICFAHIKFSSIYPDNAMRGVLVFVGSLRYLSV